MAAAIASTGIDVTINTVDHNTYQENFNTYIQQPDDVVSWFAGYRMRAFASKGVVSDISDVWADLGGMSEGFKSASTGLDGKQYFVPFYFYPWAVHYRKSLFEEDGYAIPTTWDEFKALCDQMQTDGVVPLAAANDGRWPQMGMFDMLNLRINGYDFHVSLMGGKESWTDDKVKAVFTAWEELLPYYQPDVAGRTWQDAATRRRRQRGGDVAARHVHHQQLRSRHATGHHRRHRLLRLPDDRRGARPGCRRGADRRLHAGGRTSQRRGRQGAAGRDGWCPGDRRLHRHRPVRRRRQRGAATDGYNALQQKSAELVGSAKSIAQFLDRDTDPDFAANVVGVALADFLADPGSIDTILSTVEEQKGTYTFE